MDKKDQKHFNRLIKTLESQNKNFILLTETLEKFILGYENKKLDFNNYRKDISKLVDQDVKGWEKYT